MSAIVTIFHHSFVFKYVITILFHLLFPLFELYEIHEKIHDVKNQQFPTLASIELQSYSPDVCTQNQQVPDDQRKEKDSLLDHAECNPRDEEEVASPLDESSSDSLLRAQQSICKDISSNALKFDIPSEIIEIPLEISSTTTQQMTSDSLTVDTNSAWEVLIAPKISRHGSSPISTYEEHIFGNDEQHEMRYLEESSNSGNEADSNSGSLPVDEPVIGEPPIEEIPRDPHPNSPIEKSSPSPTMSSPTKSAEFEDTNDLCNIRLFGDSLYAPRDVDHPKIFLSSLRRKPVSFYDLPVDIFIEICYHLPPTSLFALTGVNNQFRNWLKSTTSHITMDIWRISRIKFITYLPRPPPIGIDEITYIKLAMLEKGCQFCNSKSKTPKVYWAFRVRSCEICLKKRTTTIEDLPQWAKSPVDITTIVPYEKVPASISSTGAKVVTFMNSQLEAAHRELASTPPKHRANWMLKKRLWVSQVLANVQKRERLDELHCKKRSLEDLKIFKTLVEEFKNIKDEKGQKPYHEKYIVRLPSYIEAKEAYRTPFMTNPWPTFIVRMKSEYSELMKKTVRLEQITNKILSLVTSHDTLATDLKVPPENGYQIYLSDPIIDCLHWCPSFRDPPFTNNDPLIPWADEFIVQILVPRLRREARRMVRQSQINRPGPFTTVKGCLNLVRKQFCDDDKELFACKLCWKSTKLYQYDAICRHLTGSCHSIGRVDNERMIEVNRDKVKNILPNWFAGVI
ncbi:10990_t:CDS:2 [Acaulospora colombiana]|uniref:10990_t:CDS:1 n=1 Tax=Acaulospora colombiana TaxID=27376 RepID=A0ACA9MV91_9GLOM|nr:10990_t:CDS:2 [Acaulospora colombiana]